MSEEPLFLLTASQKARLAEIMRKIPPHRRNLVLMSSAPYLVDDVAGDSYAMRAVFVPREVAERVIKLTAEWG